MLNGRIIPHIGGDLLHGDGFFLESKLEDIVRSLGPGTHTVVQVFLVRTVDDHDEQPVGHNKKHGEEDEVAVVFHDPGRFDCFVKKDVTCTVRAKVFSCKYLKYDGRLAR
jgi:hypothetical protein